MNSLSFTLPPAPPRRAAFVRRPPQTPRLRQHVAEDTLVARRPYDPHERDYRLACRKSLNLVAEANHRGLTPSALELARLNLLLGYVGQSEAAEETFAEDVLTTLVQRRFNVHSDLTHVSAELHLRMCYRAARKLTAQNVHKLADHYQKQLIEQLLVLSSYAQEQENPNTLFVLSCLRNCIVEVPTDRSMLRQALKYGIAVGQIAAGALTQQPGSAFNGVRELGGLAAMARLRPDGWYAEVKDIEALSHAIEWAGCEDDHQAVRAGCSALLAKTEVVLARALVHLQRLDVGVKDSLKQAFNRLGVRQLDHEWDLAFACLDALQRNVWAYDLEQHMQRLLHQVTHVLRTANVPALRYKCIELLRDVRQLPGLRPACQILLHLAGQGAGAAAQVLAVARKREVECSLRMDVVLEAHDELRPHAGPSLGAAAPLRLNRAGSLRPQAPRFGAAALTPAEAAPGSARQVLGAGPGPRGLAEPTADGPWAGRSTPPAWHAPAPGPWQPGGPPPAYPGPATLRYRLQLPPAPSSGGGPGRGDGAGRAADAAPAAARGSAGPARPDEPLGLVLYAGEGVPLLCDAVRRRDVEELSGLLDAGVHVTAEFELPSQQVRRALAGGASAGGPPPKRLLGLAVASGHVGCVLAVASPMGQRRGFVTDAAVREAQALARRPDARPLFEALARAVHALRQSATRV